MQFTTRMVMLPLVTRWSIWDKGFCWSIARETGEIYEREIPAAALRYIEARLTKFALDVAFNAQTTTGSFS